jgi:uncharacterized C2H2 Zn-finger protein
MIFEKIVSEGTVTQEIVTYKCPECFVEFKYQSDAEKHYGSQHAVTAKRDTSVGEAVYATSEEKLKLFLRSTDCNVVSIQASGFPAWFIIEYDTVPCPKSCCIDSVARAVCIEDMRDRLHRKVEAVNVALSELEEIDRIPVSQ